MIQPEGLLQQYFGHTAFRSGQKQAIDAILSGRDVLAIMPTGAGKSVCYQISALLLPGLTIVISPLISLMKDQVESLRQVGIPAAYLNSTITREQYHETFSLVQRGKVKLLYVAPERLMTEGFLALSQCVLICMVAVDEAHCVSQWGQDFRQSYLDIPAFVAQLPKRPICTAFTATATRQVSEDIRQILRLQDPEQVLTGFNRKNLYFAVERPRKKDEALLRILLENQGKSGIIYCSTRKNVEKVCEMLCQEGYPATRYHAGLPDAERTRNQDDFLYDRKPIIVATNAFGMGIDKSNVSFIIHYNMPMDLESYYQEAGRAGRDGAPAKCYLLYSAQDVRTNQFLMEQGRETMDIEDETLREALLEKSRERLRQMTFYATSATCLRQRMLQYFGEFAPDFCGNCSCCLTSYREEDVTLQAQKIISCIFRAKQQGYHLSRSMIANVLTGSKRQSVLEMHLDQLSTYGIEVRFTRKDLTRLIDFMVDSGDLALQTFREYQEVTLTPGSAAIIRGQKHVLWKVPVQQEKLTPKKASLDSTFSQADEILFQKLRHLRTEIAKAEGVPPYFIFADATLRDMCRKKPRTMPEMRTVSGVGVIKAQKYGKRFLEPIVQHLQTI